MCSFFNRRFHEIINNNNLYVRNNSTVYLRLKESNKSIRHFSHIQKLLVNIDRVSLNSLWKIHSLWIFLFLSWRMIWKYWIHKILRLQALLVFLWTRPAKLLVCGKSFYYNISSDCLPRVSSISRITRLYLLFSEASWIILTIAYIVWTLHVPI